MGLEGMEGVEDTEGVEGAEGSEGLMFMLISGLQSSTVIGCGGELNQSELGMEGMEAQRVQRQGGCRGMEGVKGAEGMEGTEGVKGFIFMLISDLYSSTWLWLGAHPIIIGHGGCRGCGGHFNHYTDSNKLALIQKSCFCIS